MPLVYFILHLTTQAPFPYINTILAKGVWVSSLVYFTLTHFKLRYEGLLVKKYRPISIG
jgi:hypothetical protein